MTAAKVTFLGQARLEMARATDPVTLGWMVGSPPPPDKPIRFEDGSFYRFPQYFASHPLAGNVNLDPTSFPAYRVVADHLIRHSR